MSTHVLHIRIPSNGASDCVGCDDLATLIMAQDVHLDFSRKVVALLTRAKEVRAAVLGHITQGMVGFPGGHLAGHAGSTRRLWRDEDRD